MNYDLIFGISVIALVAVAFFIGFTRYQSVLNQNIINRGKAKKHFQLPLYLATVITVASLGSYGFYYIRHLGKYYYFHPFTATIARDINELDYLDMFYQLQDNSGSDADLTIDNGSFIKIGVDESRITEILLKLNGQKKNTNVRFNCKTDVTNDIACKTQYYDEKDQKRETLLNTEIYFVKLSITDVSLMLIPVTNKEYEIQISFHQLNESVTNTIFDIYKIEDGRINYYNSIIVSGKYIKFHLQETGMTQSENQTEWSYIIQV